uniref:Uncharacterized protein n=1 Tax=Anguilla anguilla TaxID=7936 RepID=A0A0E9XSE0_ANGAN
MHFLLGTMCRIFTDLCVLLDFV